MLFPGLSANLFASVLPQALTRSAMHAASSPATFEPANFESDLQSRNISGAESFLSTLQQELTSTGSAATGASAQIQQVSTDLSSGDLNAAQADFSHLKLILGQQHATTASATHTPSHLNQLLAGCGNSAAFASYNALQQDDANRPASGGASSLSLNA